MWRDVVPDIPRCFYDKATAFPTMFSSGPRLALKGPSSLPEP